MTVGVELERNASDLLDRFGYDLTFRRVSGADSSNYVPGGSLGSTSNDDETVRGVFLSYTRGGDGQSLIDFGARRVVIAAKQTNGSALTKIPQEADELIGEGDAVSIVQVRTIKSNATVIAYVCEVRE